MLADGHPPPEDAGVAFAQSVRRAWGRPLILGHLRRAPDRSTTVRTAVTNVRWSMAQRTL